MYIERYQVLTPVDNDRQIQNGMMLLSWDKTIEQLRKVLDQEITPVGKVPAGFKGL